MFLPAWWTRKGTRLRLSARAVVSSPKMTSKSGLSLDAILKFHWEVALGDQTLTIDELRALAELKTPLVKVRGQWVELNPEEIRAALAFWEQKGEASITAREAVRMALGDAKPPGSLAFAGVQASGWLADLLEQLEGASGFELLDPPEGLSRHASALSAPRLFLAGVPPPMGLGACLADDMGLGKTIQTLALDPARVGVDPGTKAEADAAHLPDVGRRQLAQRGRPVHARPPRDGPPRPRARPGDRVREAGRQTGPGPVELLAPAPRLRPASRRSAGRTWSWTRPRTSRTRRPSRPRPRGRSRPSTGSP